MQITLTPADVAIEALVAIVIVVGVALAITVIPLKQVLLGWTGRGEHGRPFH